MDKNKLQSVNDVMVNAVIDVATDDVTCIAFVSDKTTNDAGLAFISKNCTIEDALLMTRSIAAVFDIEIEVTHTDGGIYGMYG